MSAADVRSAFLEFFRARSHQVVPSSSLVPGDDPTLLFTNAGMVQFKDVFTGREQRDYLRAVSSQRCVRAGGKHNDLSARRFISPGISSSTPWDSTRRGCGARCTATMTRRRTSG